MQSLHATAAQPASVNHASPDDSRAHQATDQRRACQAATALGVLAAVATIVWWRLIPGNHFNPLEILPAIVATQVVGAVAAVAWLVCRDRRLSGDNRVG